MKLNGNFNRKRFQVKSDKISPVIYWHKKPMQRLWKPKVKIVRPVIRFQERMFVALVKDDEGEREVVVVV